jgi:acetyl-CoA C-acetyltransferase
MLAHDQLVAGSRDLMVSGGMESMTNAPHLLLKGRSGIRIGHDRIYDHMMLDGLEDAYEPGRAMGTFGEQCAEKYQFTREAQDAFAIASVQRAKAATESGAFAAEITPVSVKTRSGEVVVSIDEGPGKVKLDKISSLKPAFKKDGTITAASSSSINDGAAALVLARASTAKALGAKPIARIVGHATFAQAPEWFTTAPVGAVQKLLKNIGWSVKDVDLWEVNEAGHQPRHRQRQRWRLRAGSPDRRQRGSHHRHAAVRAQGARPQAWRGHLVHWRRRRHGAGG